jgi:hypothetical protein
MKRRSPQTKQSPILSRYTTLPVLLDILERRSLTLLSPETWADRNDREVMLDYKARRNLTCLLALCFSMGDETIHHWSAFASGSAGCRIDFHMPTLVSTIADKNGIRHGKVIYKKINKLRAGDLANEKRPFIKRWPYRIEQEYRIIFESSDKADAAHKELPVSISMDCIRSITLNQETPESVFKSIKAQLGVKSEKRISRSTLFENKTWIKKFKAE